MRYLLFLLLVSGTYCLPAQTTILLESGQTTIKDAYLHSINANGNFGTHKDFAAIAGTNSGTPVTVRSLIQFDFGAIPAGVQILSARLNLFGYYSSANGTHNTINGSNAAYLRRVTSPWQEQTVSWNGQPSTTQLNQVATPLLSQSEENITGLEIGPLVKDILASGQNYGMMLQLQMEQHYRKIVFASADNADSTLHPSLEITYLDTTVNYSADSCMTFQPGAQGKDALIMSWSPSLAYGGNADLVAVSEPSGRTRALLEFNLNQIPADAVVKEARLSLYTNNSAIYGGHTTVSGPNNVVLQRITEPWTENNVTWINQPATTDQHAVILPASSNSYENYLDIDVTALVRDMLDSNNFGLLMKLYDEYKERQLVFSSSDHNNSNLHPKLEVCVTIPNFSRQEAMPLQLQVFPNPVKDVLHLKNTGAPIRELALYDITGQLVMLQDFEPSLDMAHLKAGIYQLVVKRDKQLETYKIVLAPR